jgi:hypothetical protein
MPTFDTPEPISVSLRIGVGEVRIIASDRADTVVDVQPSDPARSSDVIAAEQTVVEYADGELEIKGPRRGKRYSLRGDRMSIDLRIEVPTGSVLRGQAGLAPLRATGTLGECRYRTGAADITVDEVTGATELTTGTGAVRVDRIGGTSVIRNANGDTRIGESRGELRVKSANGGISVGRADGSVVATTANGDIHLGDVAGGTVVAETSVGRVEVGVRSGVAAWLDLHTSFGRVRNLLDAGGGPGPGEGTVEVRARSSLGDITVGRAGLDERGQGAA